MGLVRQEFAYRWKEHALFEQQVRLELRLQYRGDGRNLTSGRVVARAFSKHAYRSKQGVHLGLMLFVLTSRHVQRLVHHGREPTQAWLDTLLLIGDMKGKCLCEVAIHIGASLRNVVKRHIRTGARMLSQRDEAADPLVARAQEVDQIVRAEGAVSGQPDQHPTARFGLIEITGSVSGLTSQSFRRRGLQHRAQIGSHRGRRAALGFEPFLAEGRDLARFVRVACAQSMSGRRARTPRSLDVCTCHS